jgi:hypothetical protein
MESDVITAGGFFILNTLTNNGHKMKRQDLENTFVDPIIFGIILSTIEGEGKVKIYQEDGELVVERISYKFPKGAFEGGDNGQT